MTDISSSFGAVTCPACGETNRSSAKFCEHCGERIALTATIREGGIGSPDHAVAAPDEEIALRETLVVGEDALQQVRSAPVPIAAHVVAHRSIIGRTHRVNQDAGGAWTRFRSDNSSATVLAVADGVSAGRHSEGASRTAVDIIVARLTPLLGDETQNLDLLSSALVDAAKEANHAVAVRPFQSLSSADATTLVAVVIVGFQGFGVWCGDSRIYKLTAWSAERLTKDHSWAEGVVSHGIMSESDASRDPRAHMITRWLGPPDQEDPGFDTFRFDMAPGDVVMCCSDGLYMYFNPPSYQETEMAEVLRGYIGNLQGGVDNLVNLALQRGGRDDITVSAVCLDVEAASSAPLATNESGSDVPTDQTIRLNNL